MNKMNSQDRIDIDTLKMLNGVGYGHGAGPFRFIVPAECIDGDPNDPKQQRQETPGVYLAQWGSNSGGPHMYAVAKPLTPTEARELADYLDRFGHTRFCCDAPDMGEWPHSYRELIDRYYSALGRRLRLAINASTERARKLDVVRAAITGEVEARS